MSAPASLYSRDNILLDLRQNVIEVTFNKINGEQRQMRCTLKPEHLPPGYVNEQVEELEFHNKNPELIAAWDIQKGGWRSFYVQNVTYVQMVDGY